MATNSLLICVVGPTAIGKTSLGICIAKHFSTEIISADSRQFFKEMTLGTAVPAAEELAEVPHHFIQDRSIFEPYNVGDFEKDALATLKELFKKNDVVVLVGGSGLYVDAVVKGLDTFPKVAEDIRMQLNAEFEEGGLTALQQELERKDPVYFETVDIHNQHRVIRALEIIRGTGKPFSSFLNQGASQRNFNTLYIGLTAERVLVYERINLRVDIMMKNGLLEEARNLHLHKELNALQTVGYRELFQFFDGTISQEDAISEIKKNTRRFAKRQGTWFRKNEAIAWFDHDSPTSKIIAFIEHKNANPN